MVELHPFLARADSFDVPTAMVFDLDPGAPAGLVECCRVGLTLRDVLDETGRHGFPKTSGSAGLHVVVPTVEPTTYAETKAFARSVAARLAAALPHLVLDRMDRALRSGRVFVDWAQNDERKQTVAAYSLRATAHPGVSTPVTWDEVTTVAERGDATALRFTPADVVDRVARLGDLHRPVAVAAR